MSRYVETYVNTDNLGFYATTLIVMVLLATLDFTSAIFAKEWTLRNNYVFFVVGAATSLFLFLVYAHVLKTAELSIVTIGWVVFLQVGLVLVDRFRYGVDFHTTQWLAVGAILLLQVYLIVGPRGS